MSFTIDLNTVMLGLIASLLAIISWFTRKWGLAIETQIQAIHVDMKAHNDKSDITHGALYDKIHGAVERVAKLEGHGK